jgi:hypothetical protein
MDIQVILAIVTLVGSIAIAWGVSVTKQKTLEIRLGVVESEHKADHDLFIEKSNQLSSSKYLFTSSYFFSFHFWKNAGSARMR